MNVADKYLLQDYLDKKKMNLSRPDYRNYNIE